MENFNAAYLDIDKTLMTGDVRPSDRMVEALRRVPQKGVNTTRSISQTEKVIKPEEVNLPSIVLSGSEVWQPGKEIIKAFPIDEAGRRQIADYLRQHVSEIKLARFYPTGSRILHLYVSSDELETKYREIYAMTGALGNLYRDIEPFLNLLLETVSSDVIVRFNSDQIVDVPETIKEQVEVENSVKGELTFTQKGVNKASTFLWVCQYLNLDPEQVLTAGDSAPDDQVFEHSYGISVSEKPLPHAKEHVPSIDAFAEYLEAKFS